jgi:hypothetical protein
MSGERYRLTWASSLEIYKNKFKTLIRTSIFWFKFKFWFEDCWQFLGGYSLFHYVIVMTEAEETYSIISVWYVHYTFFNKFKITHSFNWEYFPIDEWFEILQCNNQSRFRMWDGTIPHKVSHFQVRNEPLWWMKIWEWNCIISCYWPSLIIYIQLDNGYHGKTMSLLNYVVK